jgi:hypothetical protein
VSITSQRITFGGTASAYHPKSSQEARLAAFLFNSPPASDDGGIGKTGIAEPERGE